MPDIDLNGANRAFVIGNDVDLYAAQVAHIVTSKEASKRPEQLASFAQVEKIIRVLIMCAQRI
jgi:hypothetical protein